MVSASAPHASARCEIQAKNTSYARADWSGSFLSACQATRDASQASPDGPTIQNIDIGSLGNTPPMTPRTDSGAAEADARQRRAARSITNLSEERTMSSRRRLAGGISAVALALAGLGCGGGIEVRTMSAPDAGFATLHTFRMLAGPARRDGRPATGADDPMISNSIANRAIRAQIAKAFEERGYTVADQAADFGVAFYATAREKLDASNWDYGYPFYPRWPRSPVLAQTITQYTEGSVVVDVVKLDTRELLWRGEGKAELSDDPAENVKQLAKTAAAIVAKFPAATSRVVAVRP